MYACNCRRIVFDCFLLSASHFWTVSNRSAPWHLGAFSGWSVLEMKHRSLLLGLAAFCSCVAAACGGGDVKRGYDDPYGPVVWQPGSWTVVWRDEFDGPAGTAPDPTKWTHAIGGDGWGNKELQYYTDSTDNAALDGSGNLVITAKQETVMGNAYTSARLTTDGLYAHAYGRFEARMRLCAGRGMWPAFWILGDDFDQVGWPAAGEIDIMEELGNDTTEILGSVHGPAYGNVDVPATKAAPIPAGIDHGFHVYAVEWDPQSVVFLVDDVPYFQITPARRPSYARWVFDHPFFILLNLAVGGQFPGDPDATTTFPQTIAIDYVRVSERRPADAGVPDAAVDDAAPSDAAPSDAAPGDAGAEAGG
jgi:beta-glucanase (GH16 family)